MIDKTKHKHLISH